MTAHQIGMVVESASGIRLPRRVESTIITLQFSSIDILKNYVLLCLPVVLFSHFNYVQIQSARTKLPRTLMPICALEICAAALDFWRDIPAPAPFIGYQRSLVCQFVGFCR